MPAPLPAAPCLRRGFWTWEAAAGGATIRFAGRGPKMSRRRQLAALTPRELAPAWADQVHSATLLEAAAGRCGRGDALVTDRPELALSVAVADCVPVAVAGDGGLAVIHAGWRGIVAGVVAAAAARFDAGAAAWIGPAIGPCCYEVGDEVAAAVSAASSPSVVLGGNLSKPRLDLQAAVETQLRRAGVVSATRLRLCTRCHPELLWSYRREGSTAGRNLLVAWLSMRRSPDPPL